MIRIVRPGALVLALLAFAGSAAAETRTYTLKGTSPDGSSYAGKITVEAVTDPTSSADILKVTWDFSSYQAVGTGLASALDKQRGNFSVAFPGSGGGAGILVMEAQPDGSLQGEWKDDKLATVGSEIWTPVGGASAAASAAPAASAGGEYEHAVLCAAATGYVTSALRATPGADQAAITKYDNANSAWTLRLGDVAGDKTLDQRIEDIRVYQNGWAMADDGMAQATKAADECVANPPPESN